MMILCYELSMPGRGSWNGGWSGEGRLYAIVRTYRGKVGEEKAAAILEVPSYYYRWDDGWAARVNVRKVDSHEAARIRKKSAGFCAYDWMVDSIERDGTIIAPHERSKQLQAEVA